MLYEHRLDTSMVSAIENLAANYNGLPLYSRLWQACKLGQRQTPERTIMATVKPVLNGYDVYYKGKWHSFHVTLESANREVATLNQLGK